MLGRKVLSGFATLGKKIMNDGGRLGRKADTVFRQISNTSNQIGRGIGDAQNILEKAGKFNPALSYVADGLGVVKNATGVVSGLSNTGRSAIAGDALGVAKNLSNTADAGVKFGTGAVKVGAPLLIL